MIQDKVKVFLGLSAKKIKWKFLLNRILMGVECKVHFIHTYSAMFSNICRISKYHIDFAFIRSFRFCIFFIENWFDSMLRNNLLKWKRKLSWSKFQKKEENSNIICLLEKLTKSQNNFLYLIRKKFWTND